MLCISRVSGRNLVTSEITQATGLEPYRIDLEDGNSNMATCLHYEVAEVESDDWQELRAEIEKFLSKHEQALKEFGSMATVTSKGLDIAVYFRPAKMMMKSLEIGTSVLTQLVRLGLTIEFSIYNTSDDVASQE